MLRIVVFVAIVILLYWVWRSRFDFTIHRDGGAVRIQGNIPGSKRARIEEFMAQLTIPGALTVSGLWQGSALSLSFKGDVSEPDRQRIRNFLLATLA